MKKQLSRFLCVFLCLLLPAGAWAEPLPWLRPWLERMEATDHSHSVFTMEADGSMIVALAEEILNQTIAAYEAYQQTGPDGEENEEWTEMISASKREAQLQLQAWRTYGPALAALANATEITLDAGEGWSAYDISVNGNHAATFTVITDAETGKAHLISDLFPSYALEMDGRIENSALGSLLGVTVDAEQPLANLTPEDMRALAAEYQDFDFLAQFSGAYRQALLRLLDEGEARREGEKVVYVVTDEYHGAYSPNGGSSDRVDELMLGHQLDTDPRLNRVIDFAQYLRARMTISPEAPEEYTDEPLPELPDGPTEDELTEAMYRYWDQLQARADRETVTTVTQRYELEGEEVTWECTAVSEFHDQAEETGTVKKLLEHFPHLQRQRDSVSKTIRAWRLTPVSLEHHASDGSFGERILKIDASLPDEIRLGVTSYYYYSGYEDEEEQNVSFVLQRTEEGQHWDLSTDMADETDGMGNIRLTVDYDNGMSRVEEALYLADQEKPLLKIGGRVDYAQESAAAPDISGLTVVPYGDDEGQKECYAEMNKVAKPRFVTLILTGLPTDARPLMTVLLAAVNQLFQGMR